MFDLNRPSDWKTQNSLLKYIIIIIPLLLFFSIEFILFNFLLFLETLIGIHQTQIFNLNIFGMIE